MKNYFLKNALIYPVNGPALWDRPSIVGVQSAEGVNDSKEFGLMFADKYLVRERLRKHYLKTHNPMKMKGSYLYLGPLQAHFGHFMEESLGRLWACQEFSDQVDGFIFLQYHQNIKINTFMTEIFHFFHVDVNKIKLVNQFVEVEYLIVPEIASWFGGEKNWFKDVIGKHIHIKNFKKNLPPKIVVRRSRKFIGRVAGFDYFSKILTKNGFCEIYPEKYSIREQIEFIVSAKIIIWEQGSACHILKILPKLKSTSILIQRDPYNPQIEKLLYDKFVQLLIFRGVKTLFKVNSWIAHKQKGNMIMSTFKNPASLFTFFKKNHLISDDVFDIKAFKIEERKDLIYFLSNYFIFMYVVAIAIRYIKPIVPDFVWLKLKWFKRFIAV